MHVSRHEVDYYRDIVIEWAPYVIAKTVIMRITVNRQCVKIILKRQGMLIIIKYHVFV